MITIVDYKMSNIGSILNIFKKLNAPARVAAQESDILTAKALLIPGVGSFDAGMKNLEQSGLIPALNKKVMEDHTPTLGICLGMQLMTRGSEEGELPGLGWFDARVLKFSFQDSQLKVPHMGWNRVQINQHNKLTENFAEDARFYFVHSFYVGDADPGEIMLQTQYGLPFASGLRKQNLYGVQFHPEKSHKYGLNLMKNFVRIVMDGAST